MTDKWKQASGGAFHKWDTPGSSIEGIWQGTSENQFKSLNGALMTSAGLVSFPFVACLKFSLLALPIGTEVKLVYNGVRTNPRNGAEFKDITVYVADNGDNANPDKDIPF